MQHGTWHIELLGPLRVSREGALITRFRTRQAAALLVRLALFPQRDHPREELIDLLWPDADLETARPRLRQELASLRRLLEPEDAADTVLYADRFCLRLQPGAVTTDLAAFEAALETAYGTDGPDRAAILERAVALIRDELLPGHQELWVQEERRRLAEAASLALRELATCYEHAGELPQAVRYAEQAAQQSPDREDLRIELIRLRRKRTPAPSPRAEVTAPSEPFPLPQPLTRFFGRETEITALLRLLQPESEEGERVAARLVTLTGPGGTGKTRLALEVGARMAAAGMEGVRFLSLGDVTDARLLPDVLLSGLRLPRTLGQDPLEQLIEWLLPVGGVLILDNMEHLLEPSLTEPFGALPPPPFPDGALLVQTLLERVPTLRCLITSRQPLALRGEVEFPVPPLPSLSGPETPENLGAFASVRLFVDRAQAARSDFRLTADNAAVIAALCTRLEGIPLALELAAAWARILTPSQIQARLVQRFDLLVSRQRGVPDRHRTLRAALEGSFQLLSPDLQDFFVALSLFRGGWTLEAAQAVCDQLSALDGLIQLRERSLLVAEEGSRSDGEMRFRMLETLRDYAAEQWQPLQREATARRHALTFLDLAEQARRELPRDEATWLERLETEHDNLRAALDWCLEPVSSPERIEIGLRLATALRLFWTIRGYVAEGRGRFAQLFEQTTGTAAPVLAEAFSSAGVLARYQGDYEAAQSLYERALRLFQAQNDERGVAAMFNNLGVVARVRGDNTAARTLHEQGLAIRRRLANGEDLSASLNNLGVVARVQGDFEEARQLHTESLELARRIGSGRGSSTALINLGAVALAQERFEEAYPLFVECLNLYQEQRNRTGTLEALEGIASVCLGQGQAERAVALWGAAQGLRASLGIPISTADVADYERRLQKARTVLEPAVFAQAWERGRSLPLQEAIAAAVLG